MGNDAGENLKRTVSARDTPANVEMTQVLAEESDLSLSELVRTSMALYREDDVFRQALNSVYHGEIASITEFYDEEDALTDMAEQLMEDSEHLDPSGVDKALTTLLEGLDERDVDGVYEAAYNFGQMDYELGIKTAFFAGKFAKDYWENSSE